MNNSRIKGNICVCNSDSFIKNYKTWCIKCNDNRYGNPGCEEKDGCSYNQYKQKLNCIKCKEGYFQKYGECILCSKHISNCDKCHFFNNKVICDSCEKYAYILNREENQCELNECK